VRCRLLLVLAPFIGCGAASISMLQYCQDTGIAYCSRVTACGFVEPSCMADFENGCCPGGVCPGIVDTDRADACTSALATQACVNVQAGVVPAKCRP